MTAHLPRRTIALIALACLSLLVTACMLSPGRFTSGLDLRRDGTFTFSYTGEIRILALSKLAEMDKRTKSSSDAPFQPSCFQQGGVKARPCSKAEIAEQQQAHRAKSAAPVAKSQQEAEMMKQVLGGLDPADPRTANELAARLRKQAGWRRVDYKGDGLFDVDFAIAGRLDHDLTFPMIERFPAANAFVTIYRHADGSVRVEAPAFSAGSNGGPLMAMMQAGMMAKAAQNAAHDKDDSAGLPLLDGRFTLTTDGTILTNNTEDGPQPDPRGQKLHWVVNSRLQAAPSALVQLNAR